MGGQPPKSPVPPKDMEQTRLRDACERMLRLLEQDTEQKDVLCNALRVIRERAQLARLFDDASLRDELKWIANAVYEALDWHTWRNESQS